MKAISGTWPLLFLSKWCYFIMTLLKAFVFLLFYFSAYFLRMAFGKMFHTSNVIELSLAKNAQ